MSALATRLKYNGTETVKSQGGYYKHLFETRIFGNEAVKSQEGYHKHVCRGIRIFGGEVLEWREGRKQRWGWGGVRKNLTRPKIGTFAV